MQGRKIKVAASAMRMAKKPNKPKVPIGGKGAMVNKIIQVARIKLVQIMGFAMVIKEITEPGVYASGIPAASHREWRRNGARFRQLDDLFKRVKELEKKAD